MLNSKVHAKIICRVKNIDLKLWTCVRNIHKCENSEAKENSKTKISN